MSLSEVVVEIFTDGACKGNPGPGGWGALLRYDKTEKELCGGERLTTNNRMELLAVIRALESLKRRCVVKLHTDSQYVQKGISSGSSTEKTRLENRRQKPVKNEDLWRELDQLATQHDIDWIWVKRPCRPRRQRTRGCLGEQGLRGAGI